MVILPCLRTSLSWRKYMEIHVFCAYPLKDILGTSLLVVVWERVMEKSFRYCLVCRRNHDEGRTHIFTKQHKNRLSNILSKFSQKVRLARKLLQKPSVCEGELEPETKVWCYCCQEEVDKHVSDGWTSVEWGGLLEHMSSSVHHKKTRHFWWVNGAESNQLQRFILFPAEYQRYKSLVSDALKSLETTREERRKKVAEELRTKDHLQLLVATEPPAAIMPPTPTYRTVRNQYGVLQNPTGWHEGQRVWGAGIVKYKLRSDQLLEWCVDVIDHSTGEGPSASSRFTMAAFGRNLTSIGAQPPSQGEGNIHSGATPPWLLDDQSDEGEVSSTPIGPSIEAFLAHKERERRAGKNPRRVGADFHRRLALEGGSGDDDSWLPSFGRVWNPGPRSRTKMEFRRELTMERNSSRQTVAHKPSGEASGSSGLPQIKPYVRKRPAKELPTRTSS